MFTFNCFFKIVLSEFDITRHPCCLDHIIICFLILLDSYYCHFFKNVFYSLLVIVRFLLSNKVDQKVEILHIVLSFEEKAFNGDVNFFVNFLIMVILFICAALPCRCLMILRVVCWRNAF